MPHQNVEEVIQDLEKRVLERGNTLRSGPAGTMDYVKEQLRDIAATLDPQEAAQKAYNLLTDVDVAIVGQSISETLLMRDDGIKLCTEVGQAKLLDELRSESMRPDSFVRGTQGINGFAKGVVLGDSPGLEATINEQARAIREKAAREDSPNLTETERVKFEASITSDLVSLSTNADQLLGKGAKSYLKTMSDVIQGDDPAYNQRMEAALGENPSEDKVQQAKIKLSESYSNNNSALRLIGPVSASLGEGNRSWGNASQMAQKIVSGYQNESLNNLSSRFQALGQEAFTSDNKKKVANMHERLDAADKPALSGMDLQAGAAQNAEQRAESLKQAQTAKPDAFYTPPPRGVQQEQAPAPQEHKSRLSSVRDALRGAASRVSDAASELKTAAGNRLEKRGNEESLKAVPQNIQEEYKSFQEALDNLEKKSGRIALDSAHGDTQAKQDMEGLLKTKEKIVQSMGELKKDHPGLEQLDRSKVGQIVHSGARDAAKSIGSKLKS